MGNLTTENNLRILRLCRVPFGVISTPFLLAATLSYHLKQLNCGNSEKIRKNLYVDNLITGVDSLEEGKKFYDDAKFVFEAYLNLREWQSNSLDLMQYISAQDRAASSEHKVLGLNWDEKRDLLSICSLQFDTKSDYEIITKRQVLKIVSSFFDPLGLITPIVLQAKIFSQSLWERQFEWDTELDTEDKRKWSVLQNS